MNKKSLMTHVYGEVHVQVLELVRALPPCQLNSDCPNANQHSTYRIKISISKSKTSVVVVAIDVLVLYCCCTCTCAKHGKDPRHTAKLVAKAAAAAYKNIRPQPRPHRLPRWTSAHVHNLQQQLLLVLQLTTTVSVSDASIMSNTYHHVHILLEDVKALLLVFGWHLQHAL